MNFSSRRRSVFTLVAAVGVLVLGGAIFSRTRAQESRALSEVAPGITLLAVNTQTPNGPLRYWLVRADRAAAKMAIEIADAHDVRKKRSVRNLAAQSGALVAVNGGFFAYGGAAVGAVKVDGEWQRLPWKSRTALMWDENRAQIGALSGGCSVAFDFGLSRTAFKTSLNGWLLPGTHAETKDGFAVLTPSFAPKIKIAANEAGVVVRQNRIVERDLKGEIAVPDDGFLLLARGDSRTYLDENNGAAKIGTSLDFRISTTPDGANQFAQILGAGPLLVQNGVVKTTEVEEEFRPDVVARGPRTAVGLDAQGNWLLLVADGRQAASVGLTIPETAQLFLSLGASQAINLDGGSSTQLVINGELVNTPSAFDPVNPLRAREVQVTNALVLKNR